MKTNYKYWLAVFLFLGNQSVWSLKVNTLPVQAASKQIKGNGSGKPHLPSRSINASRAQGAVKQNVFLQDIRIYNISGSYRMVMSYIPEPAATRVGYMGFKVGEKVKWETLFGAETEKNDNPENKFETGTIDMLDSDRCYILINNSIRVAVKLYEDIEKVNR